jgi:transcriptional regulator with XRE-family HTH domain
LQEQARLATVDLMANPKDLPRDIGGFIRDLRHNAKISLRQLAEQAGVSNPYLSQIERGLRKPSAEILQQIAGALQISAETLYVRAGILEERPGDHDLVGEIHRDPYLSEEQKKTLIHIYRSFRSQHDGTIPADGAVPSNPLEPAVRNT